MLDTAAPRVLCYGCAAGGSLPHPVAIPAGRARSMAFEWDTIHYPTLSAYRMALLPFPKPSWIGGITIHHTYRPTQAQWRGARSMEALRRFYIAKGWSAGPHLFLAPDGIWSATPLAVPGVHAGRCNSDHIGIEIVGDFDLQPWGAVLSERVYSLLALLCQWGGIPVEKIQGHRECLHNKSCPGAAISMVDVRSEMRTRVLIPDNRPAWRVVRPANVRAGSTTSAPTVGNLHIADTWRGWAVHGEPVSGNDIWADSGDGRFVWSGNLSRV
jgi:hypothetical protein